jgi:hypothetical protein
MKKLFWLALPVAVIVAAAMGPNAPEILGIRP